MNSQPSYLDNQFVNEALVTLPVSYQTKVKQEYNVRYVEQSRRHANLAILDIKEAISRLEISLHYSDEQLKEVSTRRADEVIRLYRDHGLAVVMDRMSYLNIEVPATKTEQGLVGRLSDGEWWERRLKTMQMRATEQIAREFGIVNKRNEVYVSNELFKRITARRKKSLLSLANLVAVSDTGDEISMLEIAKSGVSNPEVRRMELMTRIAGFEQYAQRNAHVGEFYTLTTPSKFHAYHQDGQRNKKFQGATPREAQAYLCSVWAKVRAAIHRRGITTYGFRIAEPHHDATPHWHMLLFMPKEHKEIVRELLSKYALEVDGNEWGAKKHRFEAVSINWKKGTAAGYIAKYISKNINGYGVDEDFESGADAESSAERVSVWASIWGIRQFQQIGGSSVTIWREFRRLREELDNKEFEQLRKAADDGDWCKFCDLLGGAEMPKSGQPVSVHRIDTFDPETGEIKLNNYGEFIEAIEGLYLYEIEYLRTRLKRWTIQKKSGGDSSDTWSSVNNCTQGGYP